MFDVRNTKKTLKMFLSLNHKALKHQMKRGVLTILKVGCHSPSKKKNGKGKAGGNKKCLRFFPILGILKPGGGDLFELILKYLFCQMLGRSQPYRLLFPKEQDIVTVRVYI